MNLNVDFTFNLDFTSKKPAAVLDLVIQIFNLISIVVFFALKKKNSPSSGSSTSTVTYKQSMNTNSLVK